MVNLTCDFGHDGLFHRGRRRAEFSMPIGSWEPVPLPKDRTALLRVLTGRNNLLCRECAAKAVLFARLAREGADSRRASDSRQHPPTGPSSP